MPGQTARYSLRIDIAIRDTFTGGNGLSVQEDMLLPAADFLQLAGILGQFHALAEKIKATVAQPDEAGR